MFGGMYSSTYILPGTQQEHAAMQVLTAVAGEFIHSHSWLGTHDTDLCLRTHHTHVAYVYELSSLPPARMFFALWSRRAVRLFVNM